MPFGSHSVLADITHLICLNNANSLLDVGIGNGINGAIYRNYSGFDRKLDGIEVFEQYRNPIWGVYDKVHVVDVREHETDQRYNLIIMTDVLEHFTVEDGKKVLDKLKGWLTPRGVLIVSTPAIWIEQGAACGNIHETHRSLWTVEMMSASGLRVIRTGKPCKYGHMMLIGEYTNR